MQAIAARIGLPATCFITSVNTQGLQVKFFSTKAEYGMCGHGIIALTTCLIESGVYHCAADGPLRFRLYTLEKSAEIVATREDVNRINVLLKLDSAKCEPVGY